MKDTLTDVETARKEFIKVAANVKLHVTDLGEGSPVVFIHGWPLSDAMYEYQYQFLIKKGYRVIGITLRGFGESSKPYGKYDYDVFADDIHKVLTDLDVEDAVLCGFSMGGAAVIRYVARHHGDRVRKLALFGAAAPRWSKSDDFPIGSDKKAIDDLIYLNNSNRPKLLQIFAGIFTASESSLAPELGQWLGGINLQASSYAMEQCLILLRDADLRSDLAAIKVPTAIFHGKEDKICPFELAMVMKIGIPKAHVVVFEKSGHALFLEELDKFNDELLQFISE
jgi:pimeloyl-ACP methyl ester carboxylesterase